MKTNLCVVVSCILMIVACSKENITPPVPDTPEMVVARGAMGKTAESLISGNWNITTCVKNNSNKTELLKSYNLKFVTNGNLIATRDGQNLTGKWVIAYIDNVTRLSIDFSAPALFIEISGDWTVVEEKDNRIKFQDVIQATDLLTLEKK